MSTYDSENNDMFDPGVAKAADVSDNATPEPSNTKASRGKKVSGRKSGATSGERVRKKRVPMHVRQPIQADPRPGYRRRVVKNDPTRIERLRMAGYTVVEDGTAIGDHKEGQAAAPGSASAKITNPSSGGWGILMEIPEELYQEDLKAKHDKIDRDEEALITSGAEEVGGNVKEYSGEIRL